MGAGTVLSLVGVLLLSSAAAAATIPPASPAAAAAAGQYDSTYEAVMGLPEVERVKQMVVSFLTSPTGLTPPILARYQYIMPIVQSRESTLTAFVPTNEAYEALQLYVCMTPDELNNYTSTHPEYVTDTIVQTLANTTAPVRVKQFKDGMKLPTFQKNFYLTLQQTASNGGSRWVIPKLSFNGSDVAIVTTDIPTGKSIMHLTDGIVTSPAQQALYKDIAKQSCGRKGAREAAAAAVAKAKAARADAAAAPVSLTQGNQSLAPQAATAKSSAGGSSRIALAPVMLLGLATVWLA